MKQPKIYNTSGQSISLEYVVLLFIIVGAIVSMSTYVKRAYQARVYDARNTMVEYVNEQAGLDEKLLSDDAKTSIGQITQEYEPYYAHVTNIIDRRSDETATLIRGGLTGTYQKEIDFTTKVDTCNSQRPPIDGVDPSQIRGVDEADCERFYQKQAEAGNL